MFWLDEPKTHVGLHTFAHNELEATELVCVCVCVFMYIRSRREMFLANGQSGMRCLSLPRTSLTLFCLFLAAEAPRENPSVALLAICWDATTGSRPSSSPLIPSTRLCAVQGSGVRRLFGSSAGGEARREKSSSCRLKKLFIKCLEKKRRKKAKQLLCFSQSQASEECKVILDDDLRQILTDRENHKVSHGFIRNFH